jgi:hypothetical protein
MRVSERRWSVAVLALALLAAACSYGDDEPVDAIGGGTLPERCAGQASPTGEATLVDVIPSTEPEDVPSALTDADNDSFPEPRVALTSIVSGGPPPDGIRPIDDPAVVPADSVDFLCDQEAVIALDIDGESRAYPNRILTRHEIVNDTLAETPVTVAYCPLCSSAVAYDRRLGDRILDFGTSGALYQSALVMYDRQTESLWSHFTGESIVGSLAGEQLDLITVQTVAWGDWLAAHPDGTVLAPDSTGGTYGDNPYPGYENRDGPLSPAFLQEAVDDRLPEKDRVLGVRDGDEAIAIELSRLQTERIIELDLGGEPVVAWLIPGLASPLDGGQVALGNDIGSTGAFRPVAEDGTSLTFEATEEGFTDAETGSTWNVFGEAVAGPLSGERLEAVEHVDTFWFAWASYQPETSIL